MVKYCIAPAFLFSLAAFIVSPTTAQQAQEDQAAATIAERQNRENNQADAEPEDGNKVESQDQRLSEETRRALQSNRRTLYFVGPQARAERQLGPAVGKPKSILPTPFVPIGSLDIPPDPAADTNIDSVQLDTDQQPLDGRSLNRQVSGGLGGEQQTIPTSSLDTEQQISNLSRTSGLSQEATPREDPLDGVVQERSLERLDPSGIPVRIDDESQRIDTVWEGYSRDDISAFLDTIATRTTSTVLNRLSSSIAASRLTLPPPASESDVTKLINARLRVFEASANAEAYAALLDVLPADQDWSDLAQHQARAHLLAGSLSAACNVAENQRATDVSAYWVRLEAFCMAAAGDRAGVDFQLGILEETRSLDATFYQLLDQILIEAERPAGSVIPEPGVLSAPMRVDIVSVAMVRLARVQISEVDMSNVNMLAVPMLLQNPSLSSDVQIELLQALLSAGIADARSIAAAARNFVIDPLILEDALNEPIFFDKPEAALDSSINDPVVDAGDDGVIGASVADPEQVKTLIQMTLLAAMAQENDPAIRERALEQLWMMGVREGNIAVLSPVIINLTSAWPDSALSIQTIGRLLRAAALTDRETFNERILSLRTRAAGEDAAKDSVLIRLWPLIAVADSSTEKGFDAVGFERWWAAMTEDENRYRVASSLLVTMAGHGFNVPDKSWEMLSDGPLTFEGFSVAPNYWRALQAGGEANDPIATLGAVYALFSKVSAKDLPPSIVGVLTHSLSEVGFRDGANTIAADILISQGL